MKALSYIDDLDEGIGDFSKSDINNTSDIIDKIEE